MSGPAAPRFCGRAQLSTAVKSSRQGPRETCQQVPHPPEGSHHLLAPSPSRQREEIWFRLYSKSTRAMPTAFSCARRQPRAGRRVISHNPWLARAIVPHCSYCPLAWQAHRLSPPCPLKPSSRATFFKAFPGSSLTPPLLHVIMKGREHQQDAKWFTHSVVIYKGLNTLKTKASALSPLSNKAAVLSK